MTVETIDELGFTWEQLPSGNWNLWHTVPFKVNGLTTIVATRGHYAKTIFHKTKEDVVKSIQTLELL